MINAQREIKNQLLILVISILIFIPFNSIACGPYGGSMENQKVLKSKIKEVTVFLKGAQVHRSGNFDIQPGVSEVVFEGLSKYINTNSIQAKGRGNFTILDVRHSVRYPEPKKQVNLGIPSHIKKRIAQLKDSILDLSFDLNEIRTSKGSLELEKKILLNTKMYQGKAKGNDSIPLLIDGMRFFREKLNDINRLTFVLNKKEQKTNSLKVDAEAKLSELQKYKSLTQPPVVNLPPIQQVIVTVSSKQTARASIDINYMVSQAGWSAHYDVRAKNTTSPIKLTYKAKVYQQTGEDWKNIKLKLSTNNPNKGNVKPSLPIWYLDYYVQRNVITSNLSSIPQYSKKSEIQEEEVFADKMVALNVLSEAKKSSDYTYMAENIANVEFNIDLKYNIKSNGESHLVEIQTSSLPSKFYHTIVPKLDNEAFVMVKISDWENLSLLPASANIFFDGTYIGETYINPIQLEDTMNLSLGRDASVMVKRTKLKDDEKAQIIGNNRVKTIHFELSLKNKKQSDIHLIVEDHVPVSKNEEIKVEVEEKGNADFNKQTGALKWNLNLVKGGERKLNFSYSIKYNKDKPLLGAL
jgi:uncharacterized protein (TIGR02231 family)